MTGADAATLLAELRARYADGRITHVERLPPRDGEPVAWPEWVPVELRGALAAHGVDAPWRHQAQAAVRAVEGGHVVVATGTASGKSLAYLLPTLSRLLTDPRATALYLSPTKALAGDQLRAIGALGLPAVRAACYDGDTPREEREWIRAHGRLVLTNPDMLHYGILPSHRRWRGFLRNLRFVIVDECHAYRGVFGSHVANLLRRLRRLAPDPVFLLASATSGDPAASASRLTGLDVTAVTDDASPRGAVTFALWEPPLLDPPTPPPAPKRGPLSRPESARGTLPQEEWPSRDPSWDGGPEHGSPLGAEAAPVRRSALAETGDLLADAVSRGVRTLAFVRSRRAAEVLAGAARRELDEAVPGLGRRVAAYRGGYLPEERRKLERALHDGDLLGLATTSALELGVDLSGLDAVVLCGYPGRLASLWQQAGRAGRAGREALCVLVARDDPLDTYLVHHPEALFGSPVEATVLDPANPHVLAPQLAAAAAESALTPADLELFGEGATAAVESLVGDGLLRRRPAGWFWTGRERPEVDLRGTGGAPVAVVESASGRLLGTVDRSSAHFHVHPGAAVYLHGGESYVVETLDLDDEVALVRPESPDWFTQARDTTALSVVSVRAYRDAGPVGLFLGEVDVTNQVVSYQRRRVGSGEMLGTFPLELPERQLRTVAVWCTVAPQALADAGVDPADVPGALHAAEHAAIGLLPLVATCDRWDIGGLSTAVHADTGAPTVFVYDGHPGGAGFAERAYHAAVEWLSATRDAIDGCGCEAGCPSCVQSPKCGNGNHPLAKPQAVDSLDVVLAALAAAPEPAG